MTNNKKFTKDTASPYKGVSMQNMLAILAAMNPMAYFKPPVLNVQKDCLHCQTKHRHSNAFCSAYCCHTWRQENPQRGRGNHYFGEFNQAYRTINGIEEMLS